MLRDLPPGGDHPFPGGRGPSPGLTGQHDTLAARHARRIEPRERMIDGTGNVTAGILMRFTQIHAGAYPVLMRLQQILMRNGRRTGGAHQPLQQSKATSKSISHVAMPNCSCNPRIDSFGDEFKGTLIVGSFFKRDNRTRE
jgi:hypothetical protein